MADRPGSPSATISLTRPPACGAGTGHADRTCLAARAVGLLHAGDPQLDSPVAGIPVSGERSGRVHAPRGRGAPPGAVRRQLPGAGALRVQVTAVDPRGGPRLSRVHGGRRHLRGGQRGRRHRLVSFPKPTPFSSALPPELMQLHSSHYRNPSVLPSGAVLVVGSADSGCQIAEELHESGRHVYLCVGRAGRRPRRYRGKDIMFWVVTLGRVEQTADQLPSPSARFAANPQLSGKDGGTRSTCTNSRGMAWCCWAASWV